MIRLRNIYITSLLMIVRYSILFGQVGYITTIAGNGTGGDGGLAITAAVNANGSGIFDTNGNYYFIDRSNNTVRSINALGVIDRVAGNGSSGYSGDGEAATNAQLNNDCGLAIDNYQNLYISELGNNCIRKVDVVTGIINTFAGNGLIGFSGDSGAATAAKINQPGFICFDDNNNLYIPDENNLRIRKVDTNGIISTFAGTGIWGYDGDGRIADSTEMSYPYAMCKDKVGNLFLIDGGRIRKIDKLTGIISTIAGDTVSGVLGDGGPATAAHFSNMVALTFDMYGHLFICDMYGQRVREIDTFGLITTVAGIGIGGYNGDSILADSAKLSVPRGVAIDNCGNLYINDNGNIRIRKVTFDTACHLTGKPEKIATPQQVTYITLYPNPATNQLTITAGEEIESVVVSNAVGQIVKSVKIATYLAMTERELEIDVSGWVNGVYFVRVNNEIRKLVIAR